MNKLDLLFGRIIGERRNVFIYDIEVYHNLFSVGFKSVDGKEYHLFALHENRDDIQKLIDWINSFDGDLTLIGHNTNGYDDLILTSIFEYTNNISNTSLKRLSDKIIKQRETFRMTEVYKNLKWYAEKRWITYDTMELTRVNQMRVALKFAGVILKYPKIQDLPYEPDVVLTPEQIQEVIGYMENDIDVNLQLWLAIEDLVQIRHDVEDLYGVDVHSQNDTGVGKAILNEIYTRESGQSTKELSEKVQSPPDYIKLESCISKDIRFDTPLLQKIVKRISDHTVFSFNRYKNDLKFDLEGNVTKVKQRHAFEFDGTQYTIGIGGLHSVDKPGKFETTEDVIIRDADVGSFYPNIMIENMFYPDHLGSTFITILDMITKQRLDAKAKGKKDPHFAKMAASLKITINSIFGLLGNEYYWLYSPQTLLSVTVSGQLYLLDLIEKLYLAGIHTISANTDGVVCEITRELESKYYEVCREWEQRTKMPLEYTDYDLYVRKDVNNYLTVKPEYPNAKPEDLVKTKGVFYPGKFKNGRWMPPFNKGYNMPIVPIAMYKYFTEGIPIEDTIHDHTDLYDFSIAKRVDTSKYQPTLIAVENGEVVETPLQKTNRFLVTRTGGSLQKASLIEGLNSTSIGAGQRLTIINDLDSDDIKDYNIDYQFYIDECNKILDQIIPKAVMLF